MPTFHVLVYVRVTVPITAESAQAAAAEATELVERRLPEGNVVQAVAGPALSLVRSQ